MVDLTVQIVLSTLQTAGLLVGIFYYIMVLRNQQKNQEETLKTRKFSMSKVTLDFFTTPYGSKSAILINDNPFSSYEEFQELCTKNEEYYQAWLTICAIYDMSGIYLKEGILTIDMAAQFAPWHITSFWRQCKPVIYKIRERRGPTYFNNLEYYVDSMEKYFEEHPELAP